MAGPVRNLDEIPKPQFATVALSLPFKFHTGGLEGFHYRIPEEFRSTVAVGSRVVVPVGKREQTGVIVELALEAPAIRQKLKPIHDLLDPKPVFDMEFLEWTKWIATYYMSSWGEVLHTALPEGLKPETRSKVRLSPSEQLEEAFLGSEKRSASSERVLEVLSEHIQGLTIESLRKESKVKNIHSILNKLQGEGFLSIERPLSRESKPKMETVVELSKNLTLGSEELSDTLTALEKQAPRQANILLALVQQLQINPDEALTLPALLKKSGASIATFQSLKAKGHVVSRTQLRRSRTGNREMPGAHDISTLELTSGQQHAIDHISNAIDRHLAHTFLLHGITGSGKTEVYIALARKVLESGGGVLILVPEIALTPQLIERFRNRLSLPSTEDIAVLHSRMAPGERSTHWQRLQQGLVKIVIGARSAVFAPIRDLQLVIVDEEHESTYKQYDKTPRYHARDIAVMRASMLKAVCVLGSATPALESYYNALNGKYELLELKERAKAARLPEIRIVDLKSAESRADFRKSRVALTAELRAAIEERLTRQEGIVLFQNRRGFSTYVECIACGAPEMCPNCSVTMTFHTPKQQMRCHYCGFYSPKRTTCATCGSDKLRMGGMGTQRVEEDIRKSIPAARILRMDLDTTAKRGSFKKILESFAAGEADILLGTQMVAKGLDFPRVSLVGVISADTSLSIPEFRSNERTFQLLTQVAGRAGRSESIQGEVIIQTLQPHHPSIVRAYHQDYEGFYRDEIRDREKLQYPPFSRLILIEFKGLHENAVEERAIAFASLFPDRAAFYERMGPAVPAIAKLRNEFRYHLLIKDFKSRDPSGEKIRRLLMGAFEQYQKRFASPTVKVGIDVDVQGVS